MEESLGGGTLGRAGGGSVLNIFNQSRKFVDWKGAGTILGGTPEMTGGRIILRSFTTRKKSPPATKRSQKA